MPYRKSNSPDNVNNISPIAPSLRDSSPVSVSPNNFDDRTTDPELARYLNRDYWEQRGTSASNGTIKASDIPANPTAPSPMSSSSFSVFNVSIGYNVIIICLFANLLSTSI